MLSDEQIGAVLDVLAYYTMSDYGHGDMRPLDDEQENHRSLIDEAATRLESRVLA